MMIEMYSSFEGQFGTSYQFQMCICFELKILLLRIHPTNTALLIGEKLETTLLSLNRGLKVIRVHSYYGILGGYSLQAPKYKN